MTPNWHYVDDPMTGSDLNHDDAKYIYLKAVMLFPRNADLQRQYLQSIKLQEVKLKFPDFQVTQTEHTRPRPAMGTKGPRYTPDPSKEKSLREQEQLFGVPGLVDLVSDLPSTSFSADISRHTTDGVLAGTMLMYRHTLSSGNFKTAARRPAGASQNIASFICEKHNLGRQRKGKGNRDDQYPAVDEKLAVNCWKDYKTTSHLWAAYLHLVGYEGDLSKVDLSDSIDWSNVLPLAEQYADFVTAYISIKTTDKPHEVLVPISNFYREGEQCYPSKLQISKKPSGVVETVEKWVGDYNTKHKNSK